MNRVIAVVGMCGSGKSELTGMFRADGYDSIHFGDVTMNEMKRRGMEVCEKNERAIREKVRARYGLGAYAILLLPEIMEKAEKAPDASVRRERLAHRPVRPLTAEEVDRRDAAEIENLEKGGPIAAADRFLVNNGTLDELRAQYDALTAKL